MAILFRPILSLIHIHGKWKKKNSFLTILLLLFIFIISFSQQNMFEISLRTKSENGLIMWTSKNDQITADYLALIIVDGFIEFSFDLGKQTHYLALRSSFRVNDGLVHHIIITRYTSFQKILVKPRIYIYISYYIHYLYQ